MAPHRGGPVGADHERDEWRRGHGNVTRLADALQILLVMRIQPSVPVLCGHMRHAEILFRCDGAANIPVAGPCEADTLLRYMVEIAIAPAPHANDERCVALA